MFKFNVEVLNALVHSLCKAFESE